MTPRRRLMACIVLLCTGCADRRADTPHARATSTNRERIAVARPAQAADWVCDRVVDDFRQGEEGDLPPGWTTYPPDAEDVARAQGMYRVGTVDGRRVLSVRNGSRDISLGRGIEDWDLAEYPVVAWQYRAKGETFSTDRATATVSAVWMIGFPFFVRRLGYRFVDDGTAGSVLTERFGYDRWLLRGMAPAGAGSWHLVRANLLTDYRTHFERADSAPPTGIALSAGPESTAGLGETLLADIRLCRPTGTGSP